MKLNQNIIYFLTVTSILFGSILIYQSNQSNQNLTNNTPVLNNSEISSSLLSISYTTHSPIRIMNDVELASAASNGSGFPYDPYIIEGWEIFTTGQHCIHINETTKHFIIQNCYLRNDRATEGIYIDNALINTTIIKNNLIEYTDTGIFINGAENATVINNVCNDNHYGIKLWNSANSIVADNYCSDNSDSGIWPASSSYSLIDNNTIIAPVGGYSIKCHNSPNLTLTNNNLQFNGISIYSSESCLVINNTVKDGRDTAFLMNTDSNHCIFINNTIQDSQYGITINAKYITVFGNKFIRSSINGIRFWSGSTDAIIANNTFIESGINFGDGDTPLMLSHEIENNTVNGLPLGFYKSQTDLLIQSPHGQLILVDCDNVTLKNQNCSFTIKGIAIYDSLNCKVIDSICNNNIDIGIDIVSSPSTVITSCVSKNTLALNQIPAQGYGIRLLSSGTSLLFNNTCEDNEGGGIYISLSAYTDIIGSFCNGNEEFGIKIDQGIFSEVINNTCENNNGDVPGIHIWNQCDQTSVKNNTCINEFIGIKVEGGSDNVIVEKNTLKQIGNTGIEVKTSTGCEIRNNSIISSYYGIFIRGESYYSSDNTNIFNNTITIDNTAVNDIKMGINLRISANCHIEDNIIEGSGIYIHETYDDYYTATIHDNIVNGKPLAFLVNINDLIIDSSTEIGQLILVNCDNIIINDQDFSHLYSGIFAYQSTNIKLFNITMEYNYYGLNGQDFDDGTIIDSRFAYNYFGANLVDSTNNIFYLNTFLSNINVDFTGSNYDTTLYNSTTVEGNYWSNIPPLTEDPYGRGVVPELSHLSDITCDEDEISSLYPSVQWNVYDDNLANYEIYIDDIQVSTGILLYRFEMIVWNLADYITDAGNYLVRINVSDHDNFFATDSFHVTINAEEPITTTTSTTTTTTDIPPSSTTSNTDTIPTETETDDDTTGSTPAISPGFTLLQGMLVLLSIALLINKRRS